MSPCLVRQQHQGLLQPLAAQYATGLELLDAAFRQTWMNLALEVQPQLYDVLLRPQAQKSLNLVRRADKHQLLQLQQDDVLLRPQAQRSLNLVHRADKHQLLQAKTPRPQRRKRSVAWNLTLMKP